MVELRAARAYSGEDIQGQGAPEQLGQYGQGLRLPPGGIYPQQDSRTVLSEIPSNASTLTEDSAGQEVDAGAPEASQAQQPANRTP